MDIPVILEIAVGLVFIYLILSLLASEIQEILGTLLQWRAEHLKKSIELLLSGDNQDNLPTAIALADRLYTNPLIRGLNQEARGPIARSFRRLTHWIGQAYRTITRTRNTFGTLRSGPSYIPPEAFATTLLGTLDLKALGRNLADTRLQQLLETRLRIPIRQMVNDLRVSVGNEFFLEDELRYLESRLDQILNDYLQRRATLLTTLERLIGQVDELAELAQQALPQADHRIATFLNRIDYLKRSLADNAAERTILSKQLEPNLTDLIMVLDRSSAIYQEVTEILRQGHGTPETLRQLQILLEEFDLKRLPPYLQESLLRLAERAETKADDLVNRVEQFEQEVSTWFDRSMDRTSGVYRRNARGIAILIGVAIAATINADTFYIVSRLAKDPVIRTSITQSANQFVPTNGETLEQDLTQVRNAVNDLVDELPLPLGRSQIVLEQQALDAANWSFPVPRRYFGWLITGIAISMGSSFWFDLLGKVIKVRGAGTIPPEKPAASSSRSSSQPD